MPKVRPNRSKVRNELVRAATASQGHSPVQVFCFPSVLQAGVGMILSIFSRGTYTYQVIPSQHDMHGMGGDEGGENSSNGRSLVRKSMLWTMRERAIQATEGVSLEHGEPTLHPPKCIEKPGEKRECFLLVGF